MIYNVGLLPPHELEHIDEAYEIYRNISKEAQPGEFLSKQFIDDLNCKMPHIHFLGCFDTVSSLGVPKFLGTTC